MATKKVYMVETSESHARWFECGVAQGIGQVYEDRAVAQAACDDYNQRFINDDKPAFVGELDLIPAGRDEMAEKKKAIVAGSTPISQY
jgi:hypothetical protein